MAIRYLTIVAMAVLALSSCASQPPPMVPDAPGFFSGIIHGLAAPFALLVGIFTDVRIYSFPNSGGWYDFGFLLGLGAWGGGAAARR